VREDRQQEIQFERADEGRHYLPIELPREWTLLEGGEAERPMTSPMARLRAQTRLKGESAQLFYGYPVLVSWEPVADHAAPSCFVLPLFTQPVASTGSNLGGEDARRLTLVPDWPRVNREALRRLVGTTEEQDAVLEQIGLLEWSPDAPPARIGDAVARLLEQNPSLPALEPIDPGRLAQGTWPSTGKVGLLNRGILFAGERAKYTAGLERELKELEKVPDRVLDTTALAPMFATGWTPPPAREGSRLVEVRALNGEQRRACEAALGAPLTVITGPPGTGKSQVVLNVLANGFLRGAPVIFSSKNHKAVSVVEERLNAIVDAPIMFRLGSQAGLASQLAQVLTQVMSAAGSGVPGGEGALEARYGEAVAARDALAKRIEAVRQARNLADQLDRVADPWRRKLTPEELRGLAQATSGPSIQDLDEATRLLNLHAEPPRNPIDAIVKAIRRPFDVRKAGRLFGKVVAAFPWVEAPVPRDRGNAFIAAWLQYARNARELASAWSAIRPYESAREALTAFPPIDELSAEWAEKRNEAWTLGRETLEAHRASLPSTLTPECRVAAGQLLAVVRNLLGQQTGSLQAGRLRGQIGELLPKVTQLLPAWAVTNLSAPRALPFAAGMFEVAVIDEASQCDIPSAIPLLFRAKRAVVIGDPQQLRHITTLPNAREGQLAARHGLNDAADQPFTFVANSVFDLAAASASTSVVALRAHFRSHGDIVSFSNTHWYGNSLLVLTDYCGLKTPGNEPPGIRWLDAESRVFRPDGGGAVAPAEAERAIEEVAALVGRTDFQGTVGVVSPFRAQANRIREGLSRRLSEEAMERVELVADTAHGFQGDERDVIVFSPCVGTPMPPGGARFLSKTANVFNVAVTRARAQLRVVGDLNACAGSGIAHVEAFAQHFLRLQREAATPRDETVGVYERPLQEALRVAGIVAIPQYAFGPYRLDLAVVDGDVRIDIEVDGQHFHKDLDGMRCFEDMMRDQYLGLRGWTVLRFWALEVRDRPQLCVQRVLRALSRVRSSGGQPRWSRETGP
jgi:very-short-patch-repair endonuclease